MYKLKYSWKGSNIRLRMSSELETLLNFYNQWGLAHASIVVAIVFGLFSVLKIISDKKTNASKRWLAIVYISLLIFGMYETHRFLFFSKRAYEIATTEFGAVLWTRSLEPFRLVVDLFFDFSPIWFAIFGLFVLFAGYDEFRNQVYQILRDCV